MAKKKHRYDVCLGCEPHRRDQALSDLAANAADVYDSCWVCAPAAVELSGTGTP